MDTLLTRIVELFALPTSVEWLRFVYAVGSLIGILFVSEVVRKHFHWSAEVTRKLVHVSVGVLLFFLPMLSHSACIPLAVACMAIVGMGIAIHKEWLVGIHGTSRHSFGTIYYPFSFVLLVAVFWGNHPEIISLSVISLALGDALAAIVGESLKQPIEYRLTSDKKSIQGSAVMFITTLTCLYAGSVYLGLGQRFSIQVLLPACICAAILSTAWEAISSKGLDNLTVPLSVAFVLSYFLIENPLADPARFQWGIVLSFLIAVMSFKAKFLTASGSVATFLLATIIYGLGGWQWTMPILLFFVLSSILSHMGKKQKQSVDHLFEKTGTRDWGQVLANGGTAAIIILLQYVLPDYNFYPLYLGAVAAVTADTWGTEIGIWYRGKTFSLVHRMSVPPGTNGGVSLAGVLGGLFGSAIVAISSLFWIDSILVVFAASLAGAFGSVVDSLIGETLQVIYTCTKCGKVTERTIHCGEQTRFLRGLHRITNDWVNWICALTGAFSVYGISFLF